MSELATLPEVAISAEEHAKLDRYEEEALARFPAIDLPLEHHFTPGLYGREIFMPAGTFCTSKIHTTEHQYVVLTGKALVLIPGVGVQEIAAPYVGVTKPGTRRALFILEDCRWITFHPLVEGEDGNLDAIEERIIEKRELTDGKTAFDHWQEKLAEQKATAALGEGV